jgi:hypothetical protein
LKNFTRPFLLVISFVFIHAASFSQEAAKPLDNKNVKHCYTMEALDKMIQDNPAIVDQWKREGERLFNAALQNMGTARIGQTQSNEIIIPIVFHLVDNSTRLAQVSDRDIYEQVEILNRDFSGKKAAFYKDLFPPEIAQRIANVPIKFVLARRTPSGTLGSGIERRINTTPDHVNIKSFANGGLDPWDESKYVNVWAGTFSGSDAGLLGIATFPFITGEPQGVVVGLFTLGANSCRSYYTTYAEGATLAHELGHYFYLWHTFGDQNNCNNADFRLQSGWPLTGSSLSDDTPSEKGTDNTKFGNPSMNFSDGCSGLSYGMMYQSFMNYYDDRALFAFSEGQKARIIETINVYRPGLLTSNGATPPVPVTDAFLVGITPKGGCDQRQFISNNTPLKATVRNFGTSPLNSVMITVSIDGTSGVPTLFPLSLAPGSDTVLNLAPITGSTGSHTINVALSAPNGGVDDFTNNDSYTSYVSIKANTVLTAPFTEGFNSGLPTNWTVFNPHGGAANTWTWDGSSGATAPGSAAFLNYDINQSGTLDELITPFISLGSADSSLLSFKVANAVYSNNVYDWDGLEVYVSNDGGYSYQMIYKKTGNMLKTVTAPFSTSAFTASPAETDRWREEQVNLTPFIVPGQNLIIKFRNVNAYGNNTYLDDITVSSVIRSAAMDVTPTAMVSMPDYACNITSLTPSVTVKNNSAATVSSFLVKYKLDNNALTTITWTGSLAAYGTVNVPLANIPVSLGNHSFLLYTMNPNGVADQNQSNDTLRKLLTIFPTVNAPLKESFEGASFPPSGWAVGNPDNGISWAKTTKGVRRVDATDSSSAWMHNFIYNGYNKKDELITPIIKYSNADSVFLTFDLSNVPYSFPGTAPSPMDTLEVLLTKDCGSTFRTIYKKWGVELQTTGPAYVNHTYDYFAGNFNYVWRRDSVNILPFLGNSSEFQVMFRSTHNQSGNNLFLDNVNVFTENVPEYQKKKGYQIQPNPFTNHMTIWYYQPAYDLKYINIYDAVGQLVFTKSYNANNSSFIDVDLTGKPAGVYLVKIGYYDESRNTIERVIKR